MESFLQEGYKTDYLIGFGGRNETICAWCGKTFRCCIGSHAYRKVQWNNHILFCSYSCMRAQEREQEEQDKTKMRSLYNTQSDCWKRRTLEDWARIEKVPYSRIWELHIKNRMSLETALYLAKLELENDKE